MSDQDERYVEVSATAGPRLAEKIKAVMDGTPGLSQAELVRRSDVSHPTVRALMKGETGRRQRTEIRKVSYALGWTTESAEEVLDGGEPTVRPADASAELVSRVRRLEEWAAKTEDQLDRLLRGAGLEP